MVIGAGVTFGLGVEIPVFDIDANGQTDVAIGGQIRSEWRRGLRPSEAQDGGVAFVEHIGVQLDLDSATVAGIRDEAPVGGRTRLEFEEIMAIQRRDESVGNDPDAKAFCEHVAVNRDRSMQIGRKQAIVFRADVTEVNADSGHAANSISQENEIGFEMANPRLRNGRSSQEPEVCLNILFGGCVPFDEQPSVRGHFGGRKSDRVLILQRDRFAMLGAHLGLPV